MINDTELQLALALSKSIVEVEERKVVEHSLTRSLNLQLLGIQQSEKILKDVELVKDKIIELYHRKCKKRTYINIHKFK